MIISPQIGLHEHVVALDYDSEYANLIVNHNLSYETVTLEEGGKGVVVQKQEQQQPNTKKGLLPTIVERFLKRRLHFKRMLKELPKESIEYVYGVSRELTHSRTYLFASMAQLVLYGIGMGTCLPLRK